MSDTAPIADSEALGSFVGMPQAAPSLRPRAGRKGRRGPAPELLPAELMTALAVDMPKAGARQLAPMLAYAVEERLGEPLDHLVILRGPSEPRGGRHLALVVHRDLLRAAGDGEEGILPEFLLVPAPQATGGEAAWAVWRDGDRAVVRVSDGTGFAVAATALPFAWARAGRPALTSLHDRLPDGLPHDDLSADPPPPQPRDVAFRLPGGQHGARNRGAGWVGWAAAATLAAVAAGLVGLAVDAWSLGRIASRERQVAQAAVADALPGARIDGDVAPILRRLAPPPATRSVGAFLPLMTELFEALAAPELAAQVTFRRLSWSRDGDLVALVQAGGLSELQSVAQTLSDGGFDVTTGAADASGGAAEVEMRIARAAR